MQTIQFAGRKILPIMLSPMANVTTAPFREICRRFSMQAINEKHTETEPETEPGIFVDEMTAARPFAQGRQALEKHLHFAPSETLRSMQLYCLEPEYAYKAAKRAASSGKIDHIDLNFGCPVRKVTSNGGGSAIPWKIDLYRSILRAVIKGAEDGASESPKQTEIPVSAKLRIGIDENHETYLNAGKIAEEEGIKMLILHARTTKQFYGGEASWEHIARLRKEISPKTLIFGNGDIWSVQDAAKMMKETGANGVAVGRGACGKPWLFYDLAHYFCHDENFEPKRPRLKEVVETALEHLEKNIVFFERAGKENSYEAAIKDFRTALALYLKGFTVGTEIKKALMLADTRQKVENLLYKLDLNQEYPKKVEGKPRGRTRANHRVVLPQNWLDSQKG